MSLSMHPSDRTDGLTWRHVWQVIAPEMSTAELAALAVGLERDDPDLIQGSTVVGPPDFDGPPGATPALGGCPLGYAAIKGRGCTRTGQVHERFGHFAFIVGERFPVDTKRDPPAICAWTGFWDHGVRSCVRALMLVEVNRELQRRTTDL